MTADKSTMYRVKTTSKCGTYEETLYFHSEEDAKECVKSLGDEEWNAEIFSPSAAHQSKAVSLSPEEIRRLARDALDAACLVMQEKIGVTDGGYASLFFSGGEVESKFEQYIRDELNKMNG